MLEQTKNILKKYYGYNEFRRGQEEVIKSILDGKDTLAIMPTGAGKSLCFQIPALLLEGVTIVISPLISLMKDQVDSLNSLGIGAAYINSTLDEMEIEERLFCARNGDYKLIYIAPERLSSERFCNLLNDINISLLAIDEAHCVSQWGHDFRPSYRKISQLTSKLSKRPLIAAFTATATETVKKDIVALLGLSDSNTFVTGFNRENLSFSVIKGENKNDYILNYLSQNKGKTGIVYTSTRKEAENLTALLNREEYKVGLYHGGLNEEKRVQAQEDFSYDNIEVMVATNAFGMGIDKSNVRYVIHYNIPKNIEAYYQEAGRAGRDGEPSECILLFAPKDIQTQKFFIEETVHMADRRTYEYNKLRAMVDYCYTSKCLRKYILEYFGETNIPDKCDNCSICNDHRETVDITLDAQKIFSCVYRMQERYGTNIAADVLKGSQNKKILNLKLNKISTYGIMKEYTKKQILDIINKLIADGYMRITDGQYPVVKLNEKAIFVLKNKEKVFMKINKVKQKVIVDNSLLQALKELRKSIAVREKIPPYIIFGDASLREMSEYFPVNKEDFLKIKGVGDIKYEKYGDEFINAIQEYVEENSINIESINKTTNIDGEKSESREDKKEKTKSHVMTYNMYKEGKTLKQIAEERGLTKTTVESHIFTCKLEGLDINLDDFIPKEYEETILNAIKTVGAEKLKPIKEALPKEIDYLAIKAVLYKYKNIS